MPGLDAMFRGGWKGGIVELGPAFVSSSPQRLRTKHEALLLCLYIPDSSRFRQPDHFAVQLIVRALWIVPLQKDTVKH